MGRVICQAKNREASITRHSPWPLRLDLRCGCAVRKNLGESYSPVIWQDEAWRQFQDFAGSEAGKRRSFLQAVSASHIVGARRAVPLLDSLHPNPRCQDWQMGIQCFCPGFKPMDHRRQRQSFFMCRGNPPWLPGMGHDLRRRAATGGRPHADWIQDDDAVNVIGSLNITFHIAWTTGTARRAPAWLTDQTFRYPVATLFQPRFPLSQPAEIAGY